MTKGYTLIDFKGKPKLIDYFNEHWYDVGKGKIVPSVTSVIGLAGPTNSGLIQWYKDVGNRSDEIMNKAGESGSKIHDAIERLLKGETISAELGDFDFYEWKKVNQWLEWWKNLNATVLEVEFIVYSPTYEVAGTVDCLAEIDGRKVIFDWKTGKSLHESGEIQQAAYFDMCHEMGISVDEVNLVHIGAQNRAGIRVKEVDTKKMLHKFKNAVSTYRLFYPKRQAPNTIFPLKLKL